MTDVPWKNELDAVDVRRRAEVEQAILDARGNIAQAAEKLGVARSWLNTLLRRYALAEAAKALRVEAGGHAGAGRPRTRPQRKSRK